MNRLGAATCRFCLILSPLLFAAACPQTKSQSPAPAPEVIEDIQIPQVLEVVRDPADPALYTIRVKSGLDGTAKLEIRGDRPYKWVQAPAEKGMRIRKGEPDQTYQLRLQPAPPATASSPGTAGADAPIVQLTYFNDAGQAVLNVSAPLPTPPAPQSAAAPVATVEGRAADGSPVRSVVPSDAPAPIVEGSQL